MRTITLKTKMTFLEALDCLMSGVCIGIKPSTNTGFIVRYKPKWMNQKSPDYCLCWNSTQNKEIIDDSIRTNQYLEDWYLVVIDHRELPEDLFNTLY
jgi:hypothetical protein